MTTSFESLRSLFPPLRGRAYMVCQSFGPCLEQTFIDLQAYAESLELRPRHLPEWIGRLDEVRGLAARVLGTTADSVAMGPSASAMHAAVVAAMKPRAGRNRVVVSDLHFPSMRYLAAAQVERGFDVVTVRSDGVHLSADELIAEIGQDTAFVLAPLVASFNGALLDVQKLAAASHDCGAVLILDAYSGLGVTPLDVSQLPPCVVIGGTMKWLSGGGTGLCFMHVDPSLLHDLQPAFPGWLGHERFLDFEKSFEAASGARRFEQGTPAMEPVYTARAGLEFVLEHGVNALRRRNSELTGIVVERALAAGLPLLSPVQGHERAASVAIEVADAGRAVERLAATGIDVDTRGPTMVRVGPHWCVSPDECRQLVDVLSGL